MNSFVKYDIQEEIEPLLERIRVYTGKKVKFFPNYSCFTIKCSLFEAYCRYNKQIRNTFTRASFTVKERHQRKGHGRAITQMMIEFAKEKDFDRFMIENAITEGGVALALSCGLTRIPGTNPPCFELKFR